MALDAEGDLDAVDRRLRARALAGDARRLRRHEPARSGHARASTPTAARATCIRVGARCRTPRDDSLRPARRRARPAGDASRAARLPRGGVDAAVDRIANADDAWAVRLQQGPDLPAQLRLVGRPAARPPTLYAGEDAERRRVAALRRATRSSPRASRHLQRCSSGRRAARASGCPTALRVGRRRRTTPRRASGSPTTSRVRGGLRGNELDALDLYRFTLARPSRSAAEPEARAPDFDLRLLTDDRRRRVACDCGDAGSKVLERRIGARPLLHRRPRPRRRRRAGTRCGGWPARSRTRACWSTAAAVDRSAPGRTVTLDLAVTPAGRRARGPAGRAVRPARRLAVPRRAPRPAVNGGHARLRFGPPSVGRWRVSGEYLGTRRAAPSEGGTVRVTVEEPLED